MSPQPRRGSGSLLVFDDPAHRLTRRQWEKWEQVGLDPDFDLDRLRLNWTDPRASDLGVKGAITGISVETTIEGAPTIVVTMKDPDRRLFSKRAGRTDDRIVPKNKRGDPVAVDEGWDPILPPDIVGKAMQVNLDGVVYRLVKVRYGTASADAELTFEHRIPYALKRKRGEKRTKSRRTTTRAQFVLALVRELRGFPLRFVCPELNKRQPIDSERSASRKVALGRTSVRRSGSNGINRIFPAHSLAQASGKAQLSSEEVRACAAAGGFWGRELTAMDQIARGESTRYPGVISSDGGHGLWQMTPRVWGARALARMKELGGLAAMRNPVQNAKMARFLYEEAGKSFSPWFGTGFLTVAAGPGNAGPSKAEARDLAARVIGVEDSDGSGASGRYAQRSKSYQFTRARNEDSWTAIQRLAGEVKWRAFVVGNSLYYMSEDALYARRIRYSISPEGYVDRDTGREIGDPVLDLAYDVDWGKPVSEATLTVSLDRYGAPPGSVIELDGWGPPDGRWLVTGVRRDFFSPIAEVSIRQPTKKALEPAPEQASRAATSTRSGTTKATGAKAKAMQVYEAAIAISKKNYPYVWGGGHARAGHPDGGTGRDPGIGFDCSGYTGACLAAAGLIPRGSSVPGSGTMASSYGQAGRGRFFTVWANSQHVWIQFHGLGRYWRADTSPYGSGGYGPEVRTGERPTDGFAPRHFAGL